MALIPDDPKQRNALLVGLVAVAAFYFLFWNMWYTPKQEELSTLMTRLEQLEDQNRSAQILATRGGQQLQDRLALYERHVDRLEDLIPQSEEVPTLLNDMSAEARRTNVDIALLRPQPAEADQYYTRQSYQMQVVGAYHDVGRFLTSIASLSRIITPVDLSLSPFRGDRSVVQAEAPVTAEFQIQTYVLPTPGAKPRGEAANSRRGGGA